MAQGGKRSNTKLDREITLAWAQYQANTNPQDTTRLRQRYDALVEQRDTRGRIAPGQEV